jgi:putative membrane protein insertion efficiency factor
MGIRTAAVALLLAPIRLWSRVISPALPPRCRYYPSCSRYAEEAIRTHGPIRGVALGAWRVVRCNPFSDGGFDPVPPRRGEAGERPAAPARTHTHRHA